MKKKNSTYQLSIDEFIYRHEIIFKLMYRISNGVMFRKQLEKLILELNLYQRIKTKDKEFEKRPYNKSSIRDFLTRCFDEKIITSCPYLNTKNTILTLSKGVVKHLYPDLEYNDIPSISKDDYTYIKNEFRLFKAELFIQEYKDVFLKHDQYYVLEKMNLYKYITLYNGLSDLGVFYANAKSKYGSSESLINNKKAFNEAIYNTLNHTKRTFNTDNEKYLFERQKKDIENGKRQQGINYFNIYSMFKKNVFCLCNSKTREFSYIVWVTNKAITRPKLQLLIRDIIMFHYDIVGRDYEKNNVNITIYTPTKFESDNLESLWYDKVYSYRNNERKVIHANKTFEKKYNINTYGTYNLSFRFFDFDNEYREALTRDEIKKYSKYHTKKDELSLKQKAKIEIDNTIKQVTNDAKIEAENKIKEAEQTLIDAKNEAENIIKQAESDNEDYREYIYQEIYDKANQLIIKEKRDSEMEVVKLQNKLEKTKSKQAYLLNLLSNNYDIIAIVNSDDIGIGFDLSSVKNRISSENIKTVLTNLILYGSSKCDKEFKKFVDSNSNEKGLDSIIFTTK